MKNKGILSLLICLVLAGYGQAYSPEYDENGELTLLRADRNRDGYINFTDIGLIASAWLEQDCGLANPCNNCDVYPPGGDGRIDAADFAVIAESYGLCVDPTNPDCLHVPLTLFEPPSVQTWLAPQHPRFESDFLPEYERAAGRYSLDSLKIQSSVGQEVEGLLQIVHIRVF